MIESRVTSPKTAFCFDLDGTITKTELLPAIASELGISEEMATLTKATMNGLLEFEPSFRLRCLLLGQMNLAKIHRVVSEVPLDEDIVSFIRANSVNSFIVTGNLDIWVKPILDRCSGQIYSSQGKYEGAQIYVDNVIKKGIAIRDIRHNGAFDRIVSVGDGANDASMFEASDIGIAYGGVHEASTHAISAADYVINDGEVLCNLLATL